MIPSRLAGRLSSAPLSATVRSITTRSWAPPPMAEQRATLGDRPVHRQGELGAAADGEGLDAREPGLLEAGVGASRAPEHLGHEAELAHDEEEIGEPSVVELGEVQPRAEDAPAS